MKRTADQTLLSNVWNTFGNILSTSRDVLSGKFKKSTEEMEDELFWELLTTLSEMRNNGMYQYTIEEIQDVDKRSRHRECSLLIQDPVTRKQLLEEKIQSRKSLLVESESKHNCNDIVQLKQKVDDMEEEVMKLMEDNLPKISIQHHEKMRESIVENSSILELGNDNNLHLNPLNNPTVDNIHPEPIDNQINDIVIDEKNHFNNRKSVVTYGQLGDSN
ncbi:hypothetical protein QTN25_009814 [Entamoeba marina]